MHSKKIFRNIILISCIVLGLFKTTNLLSRAPIDHEHYVKLAENSFDKQDFDSCLYYNYILAHSYKEMKDTGNLANTWYTISILNHLQKNYVYANAAHKIAGNYTPADTSMISELKKIYENILNISNSKFDVSIFLKVPSRSNTRNLHLYYIPLLLKAGYAYNASLLDQADLMLRLLIDGLKLRGDTNWFGYAKANNLLGEIFYRIDDFRHSLIYFEKAIRFYENNQIFNEDLIIAYRLYLYDLNAIGQSEKRDSCFQKIERSDLINKNRSGFYFIKGDYVLFSSKQDAIEFYLQAYNSYPDSADNKNNLIIKIIFQYLQTNRYNLAKEWLNKLDTNMMINIHSKIMIAYSYLKLGFKSKGDKIIKEIEGIKLRYNKEFLYRLAQYYFESGIYDKAEIYFYRYKNYLTELFIDNYYNLMVCYSAIGYFYWYGKADYNKSLEYYHKAVFELVKEHASLDIYSMPDINQSINDRFLSRELNNKAEALYIVALQQKNKSSKIKFLKASLANFELSFNVARRYKMGLSSDEQRYEFANSIEHRYAYIIRTCLELYGTTGQRSYADKAFESAEKSRASLLLSTIRGDNASKIHMVPDHLKQAEKQIWTNTELISNYLSEAYTAPTINKAKIDYYNVTLGGLKQQKDCLLRIFETKYPDYYNVRFNTDVINVDSLQNTLKTDEAMLEYSVSDKNIVLYLVTRNDFRIFSHTIGKEFYDDVEAYRKLLSGFSYNDFRDTTIRLFAKQANRLYNILIKPAEPYIKSKNLIIVPDDALTQIPFEALVVKPLLASDTARYSTISYLAKEHSVTYSYSATLYAMNSQTYAYQTARLLAVAPSYNNVKLSSFYTHDSAALIQDTAELLPIPGIYEEARTIHKIFGGKTLLKREATEKRFKELADKYDIVHLATHGVINNEYPLASKLIFTARRDSINEGLLNAYEIYNMRIDAPLIVLSACNTGYGKLHKGEGIISLTRGFLTAGAKSILMTMWAVDDKTSSKLMQQFYSNLATKKSIGESLRLAKVSYLKQSDDLKAHPYFWAGYIVLGNASATFEPYKDKDGYFVWIVLGALTIIGAFLYKRKRRSLKLRR